MGARPGSKKEKISIAEDGMLMVQTRSHPVEGEANNSIIKMVASAFGTSKSRSHIVRGEKSKKKSFRSSWN